MPTSLELLSPAGNADIGIADITRLIRQDQIKSSMIETFAILA